MNEYTFEDICIGLKQSFTKIISEEDMVAFSNISKDTNPQHNNDQFAKSKGFKGKIVFGMLTASTLSTLAGVYLPGKNSLILSVETNFLMPCYVNDVLTITGEVIDKKEFGNLIKVKVVIENQERKQILRGTMLIKVQE